MGSRQGSWRRYTCSRFPSLFGFGFLLLGVSCALSRPAVAVCFLGWVFTAETPKSPVALCQQPLDSVTVKIPVSAVASPGAEACNLIAWSHVPGVNVTWGTGGPGEVAQSSIDKVVYLGGGFFEYSLSIVNTSGAFDDGTIEIRYSTGEFQLLADTPVLGSVGVTRRSPRLCGDLEVPALNPLGVALFAFMLGATGVLLLRRRVMRW